MQRKNHPRGYVMMIVVVMGIVLSSLAGILLYATTRDRTENKQQVSSVRAVYAAEAAVSIGIQNLRAELAATTTPDLAGVETATRTSASGTIVGASFPTLSVKYYDAATNTASTTPPATTSLSTIASGPNAGLRAQQTPIQVFTVAQVDKATASVADAIRIDLIPVFQFAMFFDGDFELLSPPKMTISGRVHTNGNFYLSGGSDTLFEGNISIANRLHSHGATNTSTKVSNTRILKTDGATLAVGASFPYGSTSTQATEIGKWGGTVSDSSTDAQPLSIPLRITSANTCITSSTCGAGRSCVRARASDANGVCTTNVVSRPDVCGTGSTAASFPQSLAIELIKRPAPDYNDTGVKAPYQNVARTDASSRPLTSPYSVEFGVRPAMSGTMSLAQVKTVNVPRSVPLMTSTSADDDQGAVLDRMYWKADIRIIDGVWYRKGLVAPVFDPERDAYAPSATPDPNDWRHVIARTLRYSWWWDARESRVYCKSSASTAQNCVSDSKQYQRGAQIRATDFDMAGFLAVLDNADARTRLFPTGIPAAGPIVYISETYDPTFEDANAVTRLPRTANVRNFLDFPIMHNDTASRDLAVTRVSPARNEASTGPTPPTPYQIGWTPERLWGLSAPKFFESLTRPKTTTTAVHLAAYQDPERIADNSSECLVPGTELTAGADVRPASRPTSFTQPAFAPPCIAAGATPLGPENAVRIVRAQTVPAGGFTLVTDNRLYVMGDVNVRKDSSVKSGGNSTFQDISGSVAFMADSITLLSARFNDREFQGKAYDHFHSTPATYTAARWSGTTTSPITPYNAAATVGNAVTDFCSGSSSARKPFVTYYNASLLMGDVPACVGGGTTAGNESGGVNNFPRFLEDWTDIDMIINGSMVGLFRSERGNSRFMDAQYGGGFTATRGSSAYPNSADTCVYSPPNRRWSFDQTLLANLENLPPGTPRVVATQRLRWVRR